MAKFQYTFQKIVDLKASEKTQAEWLLSTAVGKLQTEETSLAKLTEERKAWSEKLQDAQLGTVPLTELLTVQQYIDHLDACILRKTADVDAAVREVNAKRAILSEKMKDEKVWQKSKERALQRFRIALQLKEQNELDEMATVRFVVPAP
jgi:flagellar FliJ protein